MKMSTKCSTVSADVYAVDEWARGYDAAIDAAIMACKELKTLVTIYHDGTERCVSCGEQIPEGRQICPEYMKGCDYIDR